MDPPWPCPELASVRYQVSPFFLQCSAVPIGKSLPKDAPGKPARLVMVVDDDAGVLSTLDRMISFWGYRTLPVASFEDAREAMSHVLPDALVADVRLGDYNGLQLVHLIRQRNPKAIVVAISGIDDPVLRTEAANAGAAYLLKPNELSRLRDYLSQDAPRARRD